ncbi:MAG: 30S ribosomal protein S11 [Proteobacteria bacterium]|nr:30S ribosomal protein S11 [Pseudomonadota bacterium]
MATKPAATGLKKKKVKRNVPAGVVHIKASFNNTLITFTDVNGDVVAWSSSGSKGFKGSRKSTPFAAQMAAEEAARKAMDSGMRTVSVLVSGPGSGRESAVRAVAAAGMRVAMIKDVTPIPHNGCRPSKRRRVYRSSLQALSS